MSQEGKVLEYDEDDSLRFIRENLPEEMQDEFSDDEINYIVDLIYDFYEEKGYLDENDDDDSEVEINEDELLEYIGRNARKNKEILGRDYTDEQIEAIVAGELAYCDTLNLFD
ncbi:hypothetical protein PSM36_1354 [Proteiniphilum saccharofermentans]|uniref:Uncharacterized protein n=1 Tax=Proteiniphilum saccharofermentans TaxID=1642647 RepID=A0A1R3T6H3_9BACT|nr:MULTISPECIES: hypothetical protein [Proteiniphilum]MDY9919812.1 hypothetical protein [Proteiniphilum sp.]SCD20177.1 hypothetical protein PSM36_1354 [Proteiniphilum saccharofermentans]SEA32889.1 hypothetical protein SAMN05216331_1353 [Porphyromonadaceae bacterium KH3R12]SFS97621.1 hypothetical protein SAMN05216365_13730 [Porphyromonadaceae bacterium NLAE-zl-C104]